MTNSNVAVDINFNVSKSKLELANTELDKSKSNIESNTKASQSFNSSIVKLGASFAGIGLAMQGFNAIKDILSEPIKQSIELNSQYENLSNSLASLISINHANVDSMGNMLDIQEKWNLSLEKSKETLNDLKEVGLKLGYSLNDMSDMFKTFYSTAGASMSLEQAKEVMEAIAVAAQVSGADVSSLKVTLDTLGSGAIDTATDFGRFAKSLGLSTESMQKAKNEGKLYELMLEKLSPLQESVKAQSLSYSVAMGRLNSAFEDIKRSALSPYFEAIKKSIIGFADTLSSVQDRISLVFNFLIEHISRVVESLKNLASFIWDNLSEAIKWLASCFRESNKELDTFTILFKTFQSISIATSTTIKIIVDSIKAAINGFKLLINQAMKAYHAISLALSFGRDNEAKAKLNALAKQDEELTNAMMDNIDNVRESFKDGLQEITDVWIKNQEKIEQKASDNIKKATLVGLKQKQSPQELKQEKGKSEEDKLKAYWDFEYRLRERNVALMKDSKSKELESEKLRFDRTITNLNFEINEKLKSGEIEISQANAMYAAELALHEKRMKDIKEYNQYASQITSNLTQNLSNALQGLMNNEGLNVFETMFKQAQNSITQGFSDALSNAFMNSKVMESMQKSFGSMLEKLTGEGGFLDKLFNSSGIGGQISEMLGASLAGFSLGQTSGGIVGSFTSNEQNAKRTQKYSQVGSLGGTALGAAFGPAGAMIGGVIGGIAGSLIGSFNSKKTQSIAKGVELTKRATKSQIQAREYEDFKTTKTSWWGLSKKTSFHTNYSNADEFALRQVKDTLRGYEYALQDMGAGFKEISVNAGKYNSYADIANVGAKELIASFLDIPKTITKTYTQTFFSTDLYEDVTQTIKKEIENPNLSAIYKIWQDYAKSIDKEVNEALSESLNAYINTGNNFKTWVYRFKGQESEALRFQSELAKKQVDRLMDTLGATDVNIDNYLQYREEAIKKGFDPQTIANINALGEALMASSEATKKYEEALKGEKKQKLNMIDPFLAKTKELKEIQTQKDNTQEKLSVQILSTLKQMLRVNQESLNELGKAN
ncbi:hypothetical protein LS73_000165 [Helicobacter muridarum]|uniref:Uncharacterized protein n=1 Tax=Helicobacter muridarum TaxID=216 RepID=A0A377PVB7_9HELI|nr:hypothetical protein [Helicobacter muridarum]TLE01597.1 hypothetical protein LS73_000165 [Helicobacter muridarum]STQ86211.1 Uncharacterised protein [Helicobacter muridarum]